MIEQIYINGRGLSTWGAFIQPGTLEGFLSPAPMKPYVKNSYRSQHGVEVLIKEPRVDERSFSLAIFVDGMNESQRLANIESLISELQSGMLSIKVPALGCIYYCYLGEEPIKMKNYSLKAFTLSVKLFEPNPKNRIPITNGN